MAQLADWSANQMLFLDESAVNERTLDRWKGWAPKGIRATIIQPFAKSVRWSLLLCYGIDGFLCHDVIHTSYTTLTYNEFVRNHVLPFCTRNSST